MVLLQRTVSHSDWIEPNQTDIPNLHKIETYDTETWLNLAHVAGYFQNNMVPELTFFGKSANSETDFFLNLSVPIMNED